MDKFATALLKSQQQTMATMIVNGVPQGGQTVTQYFIECANCHRMLAQFNPGDPLVGIVNACKDQVAKDLIYCPTCGSKLSYTMGIIDAQVDLTETSI